MRRGVRVRSAGLQIPVWGFAVESATRPDRSHAIHFEMNQLQSGACASLMLAGASLEVYAIRLKGDAAAPIFARSALPDHSAGCTCGACGPVAHVRAAERSLGAAVADVGVAEADLYLSLTLSGSITGSAERIAGLSNASAGWALGPSLSVPVFNAGHLRALVDVERSQASQQYSAYRETVAEAVEYVKNAVVSYSRAKRKRAVLQRSVAAYSQAVAWIRSCAASPIWRRFAGSSMSPSPWQAL
ncbi:hypothetical protein FKO01_61615 [Mesorhizobium sp. B2-3-3]|nr:hypothetical protein FKO01_61615 [Mesorhizobium sp. B2-3-3]